MGSWWDPSGIRLRSDCASSGNSIVNLLKSYWDRIAIRLRSDCVPIAIRSRAHCDPIASRLRSDCDRGIFTTNKSQGTHRAATRKETGGVRSRRASSCAHATSSSSSSRGPSRLPRFSTRPRVAHAIRIGLIHPPTPSWTATAPGPSALISALTAVMQNVTTVVREPLSQHARMEATARTADRVPDLYV